MTQTLCLQSEGRVLKEATYINKSLSFLEQAIIALGDQNRDHIPFRQSKLTHALKDSLGEDVDGPQRRGYFLGRTRRGSSAIQDQRITLAKGMILLQLFRSNASQTRGTSLRALLLLEYLFKLLPLLATFSFSTLSLSRDLCDLGDSGKGPLLSIPRVLYTFLDTTVGATLSSPSVLGSVRPNDSHWFLVISPVTP